MVLGYLSIALIQWLGMKKDLLYAVINTFKISFHKQKYYIQDDVDPDDADADADSEDEMPKMDKFGNFIVD